MTDFVLVHGSGQNAAGWTRVAAHLTARGHSVATPELPKQATDWTLAGHAALIAASAPADGAVFVAHSLSGIFLPLLPRVERSALLVFLAAVIPEPQRSVREQFAADPTMFSPEWIAVGSRWFDAAELQPLAREFLFHDCDTDTIDWALTTVETFDTHRLVTERCPLDQWPDVPSVTIVADRDRTLSPEWCGRASRRILHRDAIRIDTGHCPHVAKPAELARILERLAGD